jgi:hypothetical protein
MNMKSKAIRALFLITTPLLILLLIAPFLVAAQSEDKITDNLGMLGSYRDQANSIITGLEQNNSVLIRLIIDTPQADDASFETTGNKSYATLGMRTSGNAAYNVLVYYAKVGGKMRFGYFHVSSCGPFISFLENEIKPIEINSEPSPQDIINILTKLSDGIKKLISEHGNSCSTGTETEETGGMDIADDGWVNLIDDTNWMDVLKIIPITTRHYVPKALETKLQPPSDAWMKEMKKHILYGPTIIYHREGEQIDFEQIPIFLRQYGHRSVAIYHNGPVSQKLLSALEKYGYNTSLMLLSMKNDNSDTAENRFNFGEMQADYYYNNNIERIVFSEKDYKTGLISSLFASSINSPLFFDAAEVKEYRDAVNKLGGFQKGGSEPNEGFHVYCIGNVQYDKCSMNLTLSELQQYYTRVMEPNKAILVNPKDIEDSSCESFKYYTDFGKLSKSHCKDSLVAPILASIKNELIVFTDVEPLEKGVKTSETEAEDKCVKYEQLSPEKKKFEDSILSASESVKKDMKKQVDMSSNQNMYLTVLASPRAIPFSKYKDCKEYEGSEKGKILEIREPLDIEYSKGKAVGRIFGTTVTDTSVYVSRVITFSRNGFSYVSEAGQTSEYKNIGMLAANFVDYQGYVDEFAKKLIALKDSNNHNLYDVKCFFDDKLYSSLQSPACSPLKSYYDILSYADKNVLTEQDIIIYDDDGNANSWSAAKIETPLEQEFNSSVVVAATCSSLDYYSSTNNNLLGTDFIRHGVLAFYGAVSPTRYSHAGPEISSRILGSKADGLGYDLGNALISSINSNVIKSRFAEKGYKPNYMLLGDPTIQLALPQKVDLTYSEKKIKGDYYCYADSQGKTNCERKTKKCTFVEEIAEGCTATSAKYCSDCNLKTTNEEVEKCCNDRIKGKCCVTEDITKPKPTQPTQQQPTIPAVTDNRCGVGKNSDKQVNQPCKPTSTFTCNSQKNCEKDCCPIWQNYGNDCRCMCVYGYQEDPITEKCSLIDCQGPYGEKKKLGDSCEQRDGSYKNVVTGISGGQCYCKDCRKPIPPEKECIPKDPYDMTHRTGCICK